MREPRRGRPPFYPWEGADGWMNGQEWILRWKTDFRCQPTSMVAILHQKAKHNGMKVSVELGTEDREIVKFQFFTQVEETR